MLTDDELNEGFTLGDWEIFPNQGVLKRADQESRPEPLAWRVLMALARRDGSLVTRDDLITEAWNGRIVSDDAINRAITQVRKSLDDDARDPRYVETLQRRGYRVLLPVTPLSNVGRGSLPEQQADTSKIPRFRFVGLSLVVLVLLFASILGYRSWYGSSSQPQGPSTIGVMPFVNETRDELDQYIVSGFKLELIASLAAMENYVVKNIRDTSTEFELDQELQASIRLIGDQLSVRYLIQSKDGEHHLDGVVGGSVDDVYALQEDLAIEVSSRLGGERRQQLIKTQPTDSIAYDSYMRGVYELENRAERDNLADAIGLFRHSIELDSGYGPAYLGLATAYALMVDYFDADVEEFNQLALETIDAGVAADPSIEDAAGSIYGFVFHKEKRWLESESAHQRAVSAPLVDANAFNWYSRMLASVGRLDDSLIQAKAGVDMDPSWGVANSRLAMAHTWLGNNAEANQFFERSNEYGAGGVTHEMGYSFLLIRDGQINEARERTRDGVRQVGARDEWIDPVFDALLDKSLSPAALAVLDEFERDRQIAPQASLVIRTALGDIDGAMRVARLLELPGEIFEIELLFVPEMAALRQHPDFMPLLQRLDIVGYWEQRDCEFASDRVSC